MMDFGKLNPNAIRYVSPIIIALYNIVVSIVTPMYTPNPKQYAIVVSISFSHIPNIIPHI